MLSFTCLFFVKLRGILHLTGEVLQAMTSAQLVVLRLKRIERQ